MPQFIVYTVVNHYMKIEAVDEDHAHKIAFERAEAGYFNKEESSVEFTDATLDIHGNM